MFKRLLVAAGFVALLLGWPCMAENKGGSAHAEQNKPESTQQPVPPTHVVIDPPLPPTSSQPPAPGKPDATPEPPLPRWRRPEWVIVYITALYALIAWWTLRAIKRQADTMDSQATEAKTSGAATLAAIKEQNDNLLISAKAATVMAMASNKSAKAALSQIEMMKDKERARVEIKTVPGLELRRVGEEFWHIRACIELSNVGAGRAYIRLGTASLEVLGDGVPETSPKHLDIVDGFIDPANPAIESFYFFQPDDAARADCSQKIWSGEWQPRLTGFVEYETVGTRFHRNFSYVWIGNGSPLNVGARILTGTDDFAAPDADEDKVSFGYWLPNSVWLTGWSGDNEEYEIKPQKKKRPSRQNPN